MKNRWIIITLAIAAAAAFAMSVWGGRWWSIGDVAIGPFGSIHCFGGECQRTGLDWTGGTARWIRTGMATGAAGLISMVVLIVTAAALAARRVPRLAARTALVALATTAIVTVLFVAQFPSVEGAAVDRGLFLLGGGVVLGAVAAIAVLRGAR